MALEREREREREERERGSLASEGREEDGEAIGRGGH